MSLAPTYIRSAANLASSVAIGTTTESLYLDFKAIINNWNVPKGTPERDRIKGEAQKELCRDITQFANTDGGCLLIGIEESKNASGTKVALKEVPIADPDALKAWVEDAIAKYCVPRTFSHSVDSITINSGVILAVNVEPSLHVVYLWDDQTGTIEVIGRTSHGKRRLNPDELERQIMNGSRATRLSFVQAKGRAQVDKVIVVGGCWHQRYGQDRTRWHLKNITLGRSSDEWFELCIPIPRDNGEILKTETVLIPFGLLREVWTDGAGRLNILLSLQLVYYNGELGLHPAE